VLGVAQTELGPSQAPHPSRICAAIVTYNIGQAVHRAVDAIKDQVGHVLVVDNGSDEITREALEKLRASDSITVLLNERNEGIAHAFNQAVQWARSRDFEWILTLDHDSEATPGMVDELVRGYQVLSQSGIRNVAIMAASPFDQNEQDYLYFSPRENGGLPVREGEVISAGSLIRLEVFDVVGPFNEDLFIYFVDVDFCKRLVRAGFAAYICPKAVFTHQEGLKRRHRFLWIDTWHDHYGKEARYYLSRNTIYLITKLRLRRSEIRVLVQRLWIDHRNILLFEKDRLVLFAMSLMGFFDGLRGKVGPMNSEKQKKPTAGLSG
jgi:rhamnosyltransferase